MKRFSLFVIFLLANISMYGQMSGYENGHEWVDLGLSVKWASCNIGASSANMYGTFYAWSEVSPKELYTWTTLKYCLDSDNQTYEHLFRKYNTVEDFGMVDGLTQLVLSDDAARINWGGKWKIPTKEMFDELINNCSFEWISSKDGTPGYLVTSLVNGKSIFFPIGGMRDGNYAYDTKRCGYYWSSSLDTVYGYKAWALVLSAPEYVTSPEYQKEVQGQDRNYGFAIRPVL